MKAEQARKLTDKRIADLAFALRQGKNELMTHYLTMMARCHQFSFRNIMLIMTQNPTATRIADESAWNTLGRYVNEREKGIVILAPHRGADKVHNEGMARKEVADVAPTQFGTIQMFDVSQTHGAPLPEAAVSHLTPMECLRKTRAIALEKGIVIDYGALPSQLDAMRLGRHIEINEHLCPIKEFGVLVNALALMMLMPEDEYRSDLKIVCDNEADAITLVVCRALWLDPYHEFHDYAPLCRNGNDDFAESLDRIQRNATFIISAALSRQVECPEGVPEDEVAA